MHSQFRFNRVLKKVPEKVWEALVQSQVRCNRVREKVPEKVPDKVREALVQSQVRLERLWCRARSGSTGFRRRFLEKVWEVPEKVAEKVPEKAVGILRAGEGSGEVCFSSFCFSGMCADGMNGCH